MHFKTRTWVIISLLCLLAAAFFWQLAARKEAEQALINAAHLATNAPAATPPPLAIPAVTPPPADEPEVAVAPVQTQAPATVATAAPVENTLPATASPLFLVALLGFLSLGGAFALRLLERRVG